MQLQSNVWLHDYLGVVGSMAGRIRVSVMGLATRLLEVLLSLPRLLYKKEPAT
jgi:hypothetical protein